MKKTQTWVISTDWGSRQWTSWQRTTPSRRSSTRSWGPAFEAKAWWPLGITLNLSSHDIHSFQSGSMSSKIKTSWPLTVIRLSQSNHTMFVRNNALWTVHSSLSKNYICNMSCCSLNMYKIQLSEITILTSLLCWNIFSLQR